MGKPGIKSDTDDVLIVLGRSKTKLRKAILQHCDNEVIETICDCICNIVKGNVASVREKEIKKLVPHKKTLLKLTQRIPLKEKRKTLVQNGGAVLPFLLPFVAPLVAQAAQKIFS